jgi:hypothetical protein
MSANRLLRSSEGLRREPLAAAANPEPDHEWSTCVVARRRAAGRNLRPTGPLDRARSAHACQQVGDWLAGLRFVYLTYLNGGRDASVPTERGLAYMNGSDGWRRPVSCSGLVS